MATIPITSTATQDAAVLRRTTAHNAATGGTETAVQFATRHIHAMFDSWVTDDAKSNHADAQERWIRSNAAQRTAALNQLAP